jgi:hypothetical protein
MPVSDTVLFLVSNGDYSPTAPSLRLVILSGSPVKCELVQCTSNRFLHSLSSVGAKLAGSRRMASSGTLRRVALVTTDVSEKLSASFIRVTRIGELGTTLAVVPKFLRNVGSYKSDMA